MKKSILLIAVIAITTLSANAQIGFGAQVGGNLAILKSEYTPPGGPDEDEKSKTRFGFLVGVVANIPFSSAISFRPELNFIQKGGKFSSSETIYGVTSVYKEDIALNFIELPLNIVFSIPAGPGRFCVGAGPNISFGISGKDKWSGTTSGGGFPTQSSSDSYKIKFDGKKSADLPQNDNDYHLKALDFGANALVGYKMNMGLFFNAGYTFGISNLNPNPDYSLKTSGITFKIGYMFGGNGNDTED